MKKKSILLTLSIVALLLIIIVVYKSSTNSNKETVYNGFIIDQMCGVVNKNAMKMGDSDKMDFTKNPEKHTNDCNMMPSCAKSGFGISIKQANGNYKYFKFDETGSKSAKSEVVDKTTKKDNISVNVTGVINKDTIKISKISEN